MKSGGRINSICASGLCIRGQPKGKHDCCLAYVFPDKQGPGWCCCARRKGFLLLIHIKGQFLSKPCPWEAAFVHPGTLNKSLYGYQQLCLSPTERWVRGPGPPSGLWSRMPVALTLCPDPDPWCGSLSPTSSRPRGSAAAVPRLTMNFGPTAGVTSPRGFAPIRPVPPPLSSLHV